MNCFGASNRQFTSTKASVEVYKIQITEQISHKHKHVSARYVSNAKVAELYIGNKTPKALNIFFAFETY